MKKTIIGLSLWLMASAVAHAQMLPIFDEIKDKVEAQSGLQVMSIGEAPVKGLFQIATNRGVFYVSEDGTYLLQANIYNLDNGLLNETDKAMTSLRLDGVKRFANDVIEYKAQNEKYVINVFTDITCGYCRKLHEQMKGYNELGITVKYLAFPRGGMNSAGFDDMVSVWCADDPNKAMTAAKSGSSVKQKTCQNSVAEQYQFGLSVGVTGTPNIILPDGSVLPGYRPPADLIRELAQRN